MSLLGFPRNSSLRKIRLTTRQLVLRLSDTTFIAARKVQLRVEQFTPGSKDREQANLLEQMAQLLASDSAIVRRAAVEALGRIQTAQPDVLQFIEKRLCDALEDGDEEVQRAAEKAMHTRRRLDT